MQIYRSDWQNRFTWTNKVSIEIEVFSIFRIKIENYFIEEINQRKSCIQKLNKFVTTFDYIDKILIVLSATTGGVSILSFTSIIGAPVGMASGSSTLILSLTTGIVKHLLNITRKKKEKAW